MGTVDYVWYSPHCHSAAPTPEGAGGGAGSWATTTGTGIVRAEAIMTTVSLRPVQALLPPDARRLPRGIPSPGWPSDHISLLCDFQFFGH